MRPGGIYDAGQDEENPLGITYIHFNLVEKPLPNLDFVPAIESWPEFFQVHDLGYLEAVTRRIVQLWRDAPQPATQLLHAVLSDLLQRPPRRFGDESSQLHHQERIAEMIAAIHAHPDSLPSVKRMARGLKMSSEHFSRVFHKVTGQSPRDFLLDTRLMRARHLLAETNLSIAEIAEELGYSDPFFFSRQFKKKIGIPPSTYRAKGLRE
jgi:AraC-like DNA-binding protein